MKFRSQVVMESDPELKLEAHSEPIPFETTAMGAFEGKVSAIDVAVDRIPIELVIPFLRRCSGVQTVAAIGSFGIKVNPFTVSVEGASVHLQGVLGTKGVRVGVEGKVACKSKLDIRGRLFGKIATCALELPEDELEESVDLI